MRLQTDTQMLLSRPRMFLFLTNPLLQSLLHGLFLWKLDVVILVAPRAIRVAACFQGSVSAWWGTASIIGPASATSLLWQISFKFSLQLFKTSIHLSTYTNSTLGISPAHRHLYALQWSVLSEEWYSLLASFSAWQTSHNAWLLFLFQEEEK